MKLKTLLALLGIRQPPEEYGYEQREFVIDGKPVRYAQWLHPKESSKTLRQGHVDRLREFLGPGDFAIDIGAHTGDSTLPIALAVGKAGCVLALEPNPYVFHVLKANARLNPSLTNIQPLCIAATVADGPIEFEYSDPGFCNGGRHEGISRWRHGHAYKLRVEGRNLEKLLRTDYRDRLTRLRYIKVDAEGYDVHILESIRGVLEEFRPVLKVEFYKHLSTPSRLRLWDLLDGLGYQVHRIEDASDRASQAVAREQVMQWPHFDVHCFPRRAAAARSA